MEGLPNHGIERQDLKSPFHSTKHTQLEAEAKAEEYYGGTA